MSTTLHKLPLQYTESPYSTTPSNVYALSPDVSKNITLPQNETMANVVLTAGGEHTLTNPTTLVDGERYVVRIEVPTAAIGATLVVGTDWIATSTSTAFDASANGDVNVIIGQCIGGKIYYQNHIKSAG